MYDGKKYRYDLDSANTIITKVIGVLSEEINDDGKLETIANTVGADPKDVMIGFEQLDNIRLQREIDRECRAIEKGLGASFERFRNEAIVYYAKRWELNDIGRNDVYAIFKAIVDAKNIIDLMHVAQSFFEASAGEGRWERIWLRQIMR